MNVASLLFLLLSIAATPDARQPEGQGGAAPPVRLPWLAAPDASSPPDQLAQLTIEQRVIIRVPMMRRAPPPPPSAPPVVEWDEHKGPKCIPISRLRAAAVTSERGVDLLLKGRERMRALLSRECNPASLYSGFYIEPNEDGQLCAGRDKVLARSGADCAIRKLVWLVPEDD
jgi:hypothetical protein